MNTDKIQTTQTPAPPLPGFLSDPRSVVGVKVTARHALPGWMPRRNGIAPIFLSQALAERLHRKGSLADGQCWTGGPLNDCLCLFKVTDPVKACEEIIDVIGAHQQFPEHCTVLRWHGDGVFVNHGPDNAAISGGVSPERLQELGRTTSQECNRLAVAVKFLQHLTTPFGLSAIFYRLGLDLDDQIEIALIIQESAERNALRARPPNTSAA